MKVQVEIKMSKLKELLKSFNKEEIKYLKESVEVVGTKSYLGDLGMDNLGGFSDKQNKAYKETIPFWKMIIDWHERLK